MRAYVCTLHPDRRGPVRIEKPRLEAGVWFNCRGGPGTEFGALRDGRRRGAPATPLADAP